MEHNTCRCRLTVAGDGRGERQADSHRQDTLQLYRAAPCRPGVVVALEASGVASTFIIDKPSELQSKVHQLAGGDAEEEHDRHGDSEPLKPIYSQPTSAFTRRDIEHRITLIGLNSWRQLHVCYIVEHHRA